MEATLLPGAALFAFVDWDDTLKVTNALYDAASYANARFVLKHLPMADITVNELRTYVHDIDLAKANSFGLRPENFPEAWVEGYRALARKYGIEPSAEVAAACYRRAERVAYQPQKDYPGARELLTVLRERGYEITIWTAGDPAIQEAKVHRAGYLSLVDRICAVRDKSIASLRQALGNRNPDRVCVIGNSPRSDIAPALELGLWAVHVKQDVWEYDTVDIDTGHPRYVCVYRLTEVPDVLDRVFADVQTA